MTWRQRFRKLLNLHSPSLSLLGKCRCKRCVEGVFEYVYGRVPPHTVRTTMRPGSTMLDMVDEDGVTRAKVVLSRITCSREDGTTAEFVDYYRYLQDRVLPAEWWGPA